MKYFFAALLLAAPAQADIDAVIDGHILPAHAAFVQASEGFETAVVECDSAKAVPAYHAVFDAWIGISHLQFGPIERGGIGLSIAYWPDPKNQTGKALTRLISVQDEAVEAPADFAEVSVAAQGLFAAERMLFELENTNDYGCALTQAIARQLAQNAAALNQAWLSEHAEMLRNPSPSNTSYKTKAEAQRVIYTALTTGLEFLHDQRLGRPLGSFSRPRPKRAEARRSGRSQTNVTLSLSALQDLAHAMSDTDLPATDKAFANAYARLAILDDPSFQGVADAMSRIRIEVLQQKVAEIQVAVALEIGEALGVRAGFNSLDGD